MGEEFDDEDRLNEPDIPRTFRARLFGHVKIWRGETEIKLAEAQRRLLALLCLRYNSTLRKSEIGEILGITDVNGSLFNLRKELDQGKDSQTPRDQQIVPLGEHTIKINRRCVDLDLIKFDEYLENPTRKVSNLLKAAKLSQSPLLSGGWGSIAEEQWIKDAREDAESRFWGRYCAAMGDPPNLVKGVRCLPVEALIRPFIRAVINSLTNPDSDPLENSELSFGNYLKALDNAGLFRLINDAEELLTSEIPEAKSAVPAIARVFREIKEGRDGARASEFFGADLENKDLINRPEDVEEVTKCVADHRLTTLVAPVGMGKTCLAQLAGKKLLGEFAQGVCFVHLEDAVPEPCDRDAVARHIIGRFVGGSLERSGMAELIILIRNHDLLLFLDGCETVRAACEQVVSAILNSSRSIRVLATSREELICEGGAIWDVPPLRVPPGDLKWAEFFKFPAVKLFICSAKKRGAKLSDDARTIRAIARILELVEGVPAAIDLEAARLRDASFEQIIEDLLRNRLGESQGEWLRGRIDRTYVSLPEHHQTVFRRLGVFAGGFTAEAAEVVCSYGGTERLDVRDSLTRLAGSSLIQKDTIIEMSARIENISNSDRWSLRMHVRSYALARLKEAGEAEDVSRRHWDYFAKFAIQVGCDIFGPKIYPVLERTAQEHENIAEALRWAYQNTPQEGLRVVVFFWPFWVVKGQIREGRRWLLRMRRRARLPSDAEEAAWLTGVGVLAYFQSRYERAIAFCGRGAQVASKVGNLWLASLAFGVCGVARSFTGDVKGAIADFDESLKIANQVCNSSGEQKEKQWLLAFAWANLAFPPYLQLEYLGEGQRKITEKVDATLKLASEAVERAEKTGNEWIVSVELVNEAIVFRSAGKDLQAESNHKRALEIRHRMEDRYGMLQCLIFLSFVASDRRLAEQNRRAAILIGGVEGFLGYSTEVGREMGSRARRPEIPVPRLIEEEFRNTRERTRNALGQDEFDKQSRQGASLTLSQLIDFAISNRTSIRLFGALPTQPEGRP